MVNVGAPVVEDGNITVPLSDWPAGTQGYIYQVDAQPVITSNDTVGLATELVLEATGYTVGVHRITIAAVDTATGVGPWSVPVYFKIDPVPDA